MEVISSLKFNFLKLLQNLKVGWILALCSKLLGPILQRSIFGTIQTWRDQTFEYLDQLVLSCKGFCC